jgi:hypothetical protein
MAAPLYPQNDLSTESQLTVANSLRTGGGTLVTLGTGVASGRTRVGRVRITPESTVTEGMIRFFRDDGVNKRFIGEFKVRANTPSNTQPVDPYYWIPPGGEIPLPTTSDTLKAATQNGEVFDCVAEGVSFV